MDQHRHLHIISLDVPYPPDYGGVFDLFYKLKALKALNIRIHLHCFDYGRGQHEELQAYCEEVHYYERHEGLKGFSFRLPYIVSSRANAALLSRLLEDNHPILMEGIHCTYFLHEKKLQGRKVIIRLHNVEYRYYRHLASTASSLKKKWYYLFESRLLKKYEKEIAPMAPVLTVNERDAEIYRQVFDAPQVAYLPVFIPYEMASGIPGKGNYCLYQGNLSVSENEMAALWLLEHVFSGLDIPLIISGKSPSAKLREAVSRMKTTCLCADPSEDEMKELIQKAHIHIIPSFNATGIKIKLLNALFNGRHCIVNVQAIEGTGLDKACIIANDEESFRNRIREFYEIEFTEQEREMRQGLLSRHFDNLKNAEKLVRYFFSDEDLFASN